MTFETIILLDFTPRFAGQSIPFMITLRHLRRKADDRPVSKRDRSTTMLDHLISKHDYSRFRGNCFCSQDDCLSAAINCYRSKDDRASRLSAVLRHVRSQIAAKSLLKHFAQRTISGVILS